MKTTILDPQRSFCSWAKPAKVRMLTIILGFAFALTSLSRSNGNDLQAYASEFANNLQNKIMPYWHDQCIDTKHGGYLLSDNVARNASPAREKQLVSQARMVWGFSHAHLNGIRDTKRDYLKAAQSGYRFLIDHFYDKEHGGYFWTTDLTGKPINTRKIVYGESFVIYGMVEYFRASGDREALNRALDLYRTLQMRAHDKEHGGWIEHFERDWTPILKHDNQVQVEVGGCKSANTHLHLMEALTELYEAAPSTEVRNSLKEALRINQDHFYPLNASQSSFHRHLDWSPVTDPKSAGLSYGHNVEFAWLMIGAQEALGARYSWDHFYAHLNHALQYGYDHDRGGAYNRGYDNQPATDKDKVWWVQSEMMAALTDALRHRANPQYEEALNKLNIFINKYQADSRDAIWLDTVSFDGKPKSPAKAHNWKANYHDVRALVKFVKAFEK